MKKEIKIVLVSVASLIAFNLASVSDAAAAAEGTDGFSVVANSSVAKTSISRTEMKQIMLANQTKWPGGKNIVIVALSSDAAEGDSVAQAYMSLTSDQAKKYWLTKVFNLVLPGLPLFGDSTEEVIDKVATTPGSVAVIPKGKDIGKTKILQETN